jgi:chromosome partitioning protein
VLICDLDAQGNSADALGLAKNGGLYRLLIDGAGADAVTPSGRDNLDVITSDKKTVEAKAILAGQPFREQAVDKALAGLADGYDVALIDCAPSVDLLQIAALLASGGHAESHRGARDGSFYCAWFFSARGR